MPDTERGAATTASRSVTGRKDHEALKAALWDYPISRSAARTFLRSGLSPTRHEIFLLRSHFFLLWSHCLFVGPQCLRVGSLTFFPWPAVFDLRSAFFFVRSVGVATLSDYLRERSVDTFVGHAFVITRAAGVGARSVSAVGGAADNWHWPREVISRHASFPDRAAGIYLRFDPDFRRSADSFPRCARKNLPTACVCRRCVFFGGRERLTSHASAASKDT